MDVQQYKAEIDRAIEQERRTGVLRDRILDALPGSDDPAQDCYEVHQFIAGYVRASAEVLDQARAIAEARDLGQTVGPFIDASLRYIQERADFIHDDAGLVGFVDDAYFVFSLMQRVSETHGGGGGTSLFPFDYRTANSKMRTMIGDATATRIDAAVGHLLETADHAEPARTLLSLIADGATSAGLPLAERPMPNVPELNLGQL